MKKLLSALIHVLNRYISETQDLQQVMNAQAVSLHKLHHKTNRLTLLTERILEQMTTDFQSLLDEAKRQGEQLDKVLEEVKAGNASVISAEQVEELKAALDANQTKIQSIDDQHPDTLTADPTPAGGEATGSAGDTATTTTPGDETTATGEGASA